MRAHASVCVCVGGALCCQYKLIVQVLACSILLHPMVKTSFSLHWGTGPLATPFHWSAGRSACSCVQLRAVLYGLCWVSRPSLAHPSTGKCRPGPSEVTRLGEVAGTQLSVTRWLDCAALGSFGSQLAWQSGHARPLQSTDGDSQGPKKWLVGFLRKPPENHNWSSDKARRLVMCEAITSPPTSSTASGASKVYNSSSELVRLKGSKAGMLRVAHSWYLKQQVRVVNFSISCGIETESFVMVPHRTIVFLVRGHLNLWT